MVKTVPIGEIENEVPIGTTNNEVPTEITGSEVPLGITENEVPSGTIESGVHIGKEENTVPVMDITCIHGTENVQRRDKTILTLTDITKIEDQDLMTEKERNQQNTIQLSNLNCSVDRHLLCENLHLRSLSFVRGSGGTGRGHPATEANYWQ